MLELVSQSYWCPSISCYIAKYMSSCDACQHVKAFPTMKSRKLMLNRIPKQHWQVISVNLITELPLSHGYNIILVVVDQLSKRIHTIPMTTRVDSSRIAHLFLEHVWHHHRILEQILSDWGSTFISKFSTE